MSEIDVYRIARLLIEEYGVFAEDEIKAKLKHYTDSKDFGSIKVWYEVEDALHEIKGTKRKKEREKEEVIN